MKDIEPWSKLLPAIVAAIGIMILIVGSLRYKVSLLHPAKKSAHEQEEFDRKNSNEQIKQTITSRHIALGYGLLEIGKFEDAKTEFLNAQSIDSYSNEASLGLFKSRTLIETQGDFDIEVMAKKANTIFDFNSQDPHAFYLLGLIYRDVNTRLSMYNFRKAIEYHTNFPDAYYRIGMLYETKDHLITQDALEYYVIAHESSPLNMNYLNNIAYQYFQNGQYENAIAKYYEVMKLDKKDLLPNLTISHSFLLLNNFTESARYVNSFLKMVERDNSLLDTKVNKMQWFFEEFDKYKILVETKNKKLCYDYLMSFYKNCLAGNSVKGLSDLQKGFDIYKSDWDCENVKRLIEFEIGNYIKKTTAAQDVKDFIFTNFTQVFEK